MQRFAALWMTSSLLPAGRSLSPGTTSVVIFCHGSGDTGEGAESYVEAVTPARTMAALKAAGVHLEYPSANPRPYRLAGGLETSVWFDRFGGMEPTNPEDTDSVESSARKLDELIGSIVAQGVPAGRIALGGFSMGGGMALQTAARSGYRLGAVFALSAYLCNDSSVYTLCGGGANASAGKIDASNGLRSAPVFMAHGDADDFVLPEWGESTAKRLQALGVDVKPFVHVPRAGHELTSSELGQLFEFLLTAICTADDNPPI